MNKIKLQDIEENNKKAISSYIENNIGFINEYFYVQNSENIVDLIKKIQYNNEKNNAHFLTGFFWNQTPDSYQLGENCGKFFLRLSGYQDNNTFIETKELSLEEKINFIENLNFVVTNNSILKDMFKLSENTFIEKMIVLGKNEEFFKQIKVEFCNDWIEEETMKYIVQEGVKMLENLNLKKRLENSNDTSIKLKKAKI